MRCVIPTRTRPGNELGNTPPTRTDAGRSAHHAKPCAKLSRRAMRQRKRAKRGTSAPRARPGAFRIHKYSDSYSTADAAYKLHVQARRVSAVARSGTVTVPPARRALPAQL